MSDYRIPKMEASEDGSSVSIDLTPMVHDLTRQVVKRVEEGAVDEVVAFLAANGHLADVIRKAKAEALTEAAESLEPSEKDNPLLAALIKINPTAQMVFEYAREVLTVRAQQLTEGS